ncbi:uncharacterized protein N7483_013057 [Penicillium malachiteum]|uniref:uncharacterized protein n=1 Tax=Penicillium malachiteum TaxID=1324776 RepID=UPI0025468EAB|nr:uncharacterized protein N7483_013057 [Penicillium malachiteum]KAJ5715876.1 hypothetical protein N7483_013057 [Penicillium malachiteum]
MDISFGLKISLETPILLTSNPQSPIVLPLTVFIQNENQYPVTIVKWNTPLDPIAGSLDIFHICDTTSGETLAADTIKISRKLPASHNDLVQIDGGQTIQCQHDLTGLNFQKDHEYSIRAQGTWHAVWKCPLADVTASQIQTLTGDKRGEFQSEFAVFTVK